MSVLLWTNQIQKFADFAENNKKYLKDFGNIRIFGEDLKVSDYNRLCNLHLDDMEILSPIGNERDTLMFCLGEAYAKHTENLYVLSNVDKGVIDFAKSQGIEITLLSNLSKPTAKSVTTRKPRVSKKIVENVATEDSLPARETASTKMPKEKEVKSEVKVKTERKSSEISELLKSTVAKAEKETNLSFSDRLDEIDRGIRNASDAKVGLPFQMQLLFGKENADILAKYLMPHFNELRK